MATKTKTVDIPSRCAKQARTKTPPCTPSLEDQRKILEEETKRLDALDIEECKSTFNWMVNELMERYGCKILVQGRFVGNQISTEILIVKAK